MQDNERWAEELEILASVIRKAPLDITIKWGSEVFTFRGKNVISYGGFKNYFALWFYNGVFLKDPYEVLINAQEGKTKSLRQWRFTSANEIDERRILEYIEEAIEIEKKGLKIQPDRFRTVTIPDWFSQVIEADDDLKAAFEKLTPGRQIEYILFLEEAKQESTKMKRLMKISPMILKGSGLNDKYRS
jgi:uncharacterized protein YdeI (YjbR/CyaY-like superfamily)